MSLFLHPWLMVWFLFHGLTSFPCSSLPQSFLVFCGGSAGDISWQSLPCHLYKTKTHSSLWCLGVTSPRLYAFVTPLLVNWAILPCSVMAVQDCLSCFDSPLELPVACCQLQFFVSVVPSSWAFLTSLVGQTWLLEAYNYLFILFLL